MQIAWTPDKAWVPLCIEVNVGWGKGIGRRQTSIELCGRSGDEGIKEPDLQPVRLDNLSDNHITLDSVTEQEMPECHPLATSERQFRADEVTKDK